jgi:glycosyltransferase involved in cell wall biosynthesis
MSNSFKEISVVMCCHNSEKRIENTLQYLSQQILSSPEYRFEIILVDNNCKDNTVDIAKKIWAPFQEKYPMHIVYEQKPGKSNALMAGYDAANYEIILLCDDDNWLCVDYFDITLSLFNQYPHIGMLGGYGSEARFGESVEEPIWFKEMSGAYFVGKFIESSGFLPATNFNIWGAGSVIRKTMWNYLISNGFEFKNSLQAGKAQAEDAELAKIITITGHPLYFDERLTFIHDLSGGRVSEQNLDSQIIINAKCYGWLVFYKIMVKQVKFKKDNLFLFFYVREMLVIIKTLLQKRSTNNKSIHRFLKKDYKEILFDKYLLKEMLLHFFTYYKARKSGLAFIKKIYNQQPLSSN